MRIRNERESLGVPFYVDLQRELEARGSPEPELADTVRFYKALFELLAQVEASFRPPLEATEGAASRLARGIPAIAPEAFVAEEQELDSAWQGVCELVAGYRPDLSPELETVRAWVQTRDNALLQAARFYLRGELPLLAGEVSLDVELLSVLLNNALHPFLHCYARAVLPLLNGISWARPYCPVCGGEPDFACLAKPHGARWLLCSRCDCQWSFRRIACPFCGGDRPGLVQYIPSADGALRLYLYDCCGRYLKTLDRRELIDGRSLAVERILTGLADLAAQQAGYR